MPKPMHPMHARRAVHEAATEVNFDGALAIKLAGQLFDGVEELGLKRKAEEVYCALVQLQLELTAEQLAAYHSGRAAVEQKFAPRQIVSDADYNEAKEHVVAVKETLNCERANLYTAVLLGSGVKEAERSFKSARAALADAEAKVTKAHQELRATQERRSGETETLRLQLESFDETNSLIFAFLAWSKQRQSALKNEFDALSEYGSR